MTRIEFFILQGSRIDDRLRLVCQLIERAVQGGDRLFVHGEDRVLLNALDDRLWNYRDTSFVAHCLLERDTLAAGCAEPVVLSSGEPTGDYALLINLAADVPSFFSRFERTFEIVNQAEDVRDAGRKRFRFYRERGYPLQHHHVGPI